uniref:Uncharacterized protein n=1 Tax=Oncorhynchus tshawytscha TaxID=74940 RepID=A0A8C8G1D6_ONCTS
NPVCLWVSYRKQAADFYTEHQTNFFMLGFSDTWKQFMTSGPGVAMELMGEEAVSRPDQASEPLDDTRNAGHRSDSLASAARVSHSSRENRRGPSRTVETGAAARSGGLGTARSHHVR